MLLIFPALRWVRQVRQWDIFWVGERDKGKAALGRKVLGACLGAEEGLEVRRKGEQHLKSGGRVLLIPGFLVFLRTTLWTVPLPGQSRLSLPSVGTLGLLAGANNPMTTVRLMAGPGWLPALLCHRGGAGRASMAVPELSAPQALVSAV